MRLVTWNANDNNRHRSFEENVELLKELEPDLIILSETARPRNRDHDQLVCLGSESPSLAVIASGNFRISPVKVYPDAPMYFGAFRVSGPCSLNLLAGWPVQQKRGAAYSKLLQHALNIFGGFLPDKRTAFIGDLNTSSKAQGQETTHPEFVARLAGFGLTSIYHHQTNEAHGSETIITYRGGRGFHLDYCFLSEDLLRSATVEIVNGPEWRGRSDHFPVLVKIPEAARE